MLRLLVLTVLTLATVPFHWSLSTTVPIASAAEPLNVVVTLPVLKDWAQQIGGSHVHVTSLMTGYESEHT
ncbi:MAG: hypothetical protein ACXW39_02655, partial [Nitrospira sp.]